MRCVSVRFLAQRFYDGHHMRCPFFRRCSERLVRVRRSPVHAARRCYPGFPALLVLLSSLFSAFCRPHAPSDALREPACWKSTPEFGQIEDIRWSCRLPIAFRCRLFKPTSIRPGVLLTRLFRERSKTSKRGGFAPSDHRISSISPSLPLFFQQGGAKPQGGGRQAPLLLSVSAAVDSNRSQQDALLQKNASVIPSARR